MLYKYGKELRFETFFFTQVNKIGIFFCLTRFKGAHTTFEIKLHVSPYDVSFNIAERGVSSKSPIYLYYVNFIKTLMSHYVILFIQNCCRKYHEH